MPSDNKSTFHIEFQPVGKRIDVTRKKTILEAASQAGIDLAVVCGGKGTCGTCLVKVVAGKYSKITSQEEAKIPSIKLKKGFRLACQAVIQNDGKIEIPLQSLTAPQRTQVEGDEKDFSIDPAVTSIELNITPPTLENPTADSKSLNLYFRSKGIRNNQIQRDSGTSLSTQLRAIHWKGEGVLRKTGNSTSLLDIIPDKRYLLGLAVDIGTTKLAMYLVDLRNGKTLTKLGDMNPQISYGEDVISRISYCNKHAEGRQNLQRILVEKINEMINECCRSTQTKPDQIYEMCAVGNTAMHHLFCGFPVKQLGEAPYVASIRESVEFPAKDIGLNLAPGAMVVLPPNIAGFVGADHMSMLLATKAWQTKKTTIALDIGTNTEIALIHEGEISCCSCASGPAFEGAHITSGMRAARGAIERVMFENDMFEYKTIENEPAVGICGSGILDAIAEMKSAGIVDKRGSLKKGHPLVDSIGCLIVKGEDSATGEPIHITRGDVHQVQLAKAAIRAGWESLLAAKGLAEKDIQQCIVAGAFGTYLRIESAIQIGMLPDIPTERYKQVGNAAGVGAKYLLLDRKLRKQADILSEKIEYLELNNQPNFMNRYINSLFL